jgi:DNA-binding transcriptional LysR family regulator
VRRIEREDDDTRHVAVETIARGGAGVTVLPHLQTRRQDNPEGVLCVLLPAPDEPSQEIRLLMPSDTFSGSTALEMRAYDHRYLLIPIELVEASADWQVARFKILRPADG